ncbi:MAG: hypothetical protein H0W83_03845 [Planctomycetes bacterium]|nr:hypothetical protein [Planctomycetota bacterium]
MSTVRRRPLWQLVAPLLAVLAVRGWSGDAPIPVQSELLKLSEPQRQKALAELTLATPVRFAGGRIRLSDAVALLSAGGNATTLDPAVDGQREGELPALMGSYWEAVRAVCEAFHLDLKPGIPRGPATTTRTDRLVAVESGAVELRASVGGRRHALVANGALLAVIEECEVRHTSGARREHMAELVLSLRLEPKIASDRIGGASVHVARIEDGSGHALTSEPDATPDGEVVGRLRLRMKVGEDLNAMTLSGDIDLMLVEPWRVTMPLRPGASVAIACGANAMTLNLVDSDHVGLSGGPGPMLELVFPRDGQLLDPKMHLVSAGKTVQSSGSGGSQTGAGRVLYMTFKTLADGAYDGVVWGTARLKSARMELKVPIDFTRLPTDPPEGDADLALFTPSRVAWPQGRVTLEEATRRLSEGGNQVLLQLGADEHKECELPAFSGTFWEGVLAVCRAFDVAIMPPTAPPMGMSGAGDGSTAIAGGPVSLGPKLATMSHQQANGPLLVEIADVTVTTSRSIQGSGRQAEAICHFRIEPRVNGELVGSCAATANSFAVDDRGRTVQTDEPQPTDEEPDARNMRNVRMQVMIGRMNGVRYNGEETPPRYDIPLSVSNLATDASSFRTTGQVRLEVNRQIKAEASLTPGVSTLITMGATSVTATLYDSTSAEAVNLRQPGLGLMGQGRLTEAGIRLIPPSGSQITTNGRGSWVNHGRQEILYFYPITEEGPYHLVISDVVHLADIKLPYAVDIPLP